MASKDREHYIPRPQRTSQRPHFEASYLLFDILALDLNADEFLPAIFCSFIFHRGWFYELFMIQPITSAWNLSQKQLDIIFWSIFVTAQLFLGLSASLDLIPFCAHILRLWCICFRFPTVYTATFRRTISMRTSVASDLRRLE